MQAGPVIGREVSDITHVDAGAILGPTADRHYVDWGVRISGWFDQPPERCGAPIRKVGCRSARQDRGHVPRVRRHDGPQEVNASMQATKPTAAYAMANRAKAHAQLKKLRSRAHALLAPGQIADLLLQLAAHSKVVVWSDPASGRPRAP